MIYIFVIFLQLQGSFVQFQLSPLILTYRQMTPVEKLRATLDNFTNSVRTLCIVMTHTQRFCSVSFCMSHRSYLSILATALEACSCLRTCVSLWFPHEDPLSLEDHHEQSSSLCLLHTDVQPFPEYSVILSDLIFLLRKVLKSVNISWPLLGIFV